MTRAINYLLAALSVLGSVEAWSDSHGHAGASVVLAAMANGIGDLTFASTEWVEAARPAIQEIAGRHREALEGLDFTLCEVAHNAPAYLKVGPILAWYARFEGADVTVGGSELTAEECTIRIEGDHSIMSNLGRILNHGRDPAIVAAAQARLRKLSKWIVVGRLPEHPVLASVLRAFHDRMAVRTMPRFVFMTPEWVSSARYIVSSRAQLPEYADGIKDVVFKFSEEFTHTPAYGFPDGSHGGFWVYASHGEVTVGAGPLPEALAPADYLTKGQYTPVVPVGRTVNALMTDNDKAEQKTYGAAAFKPDPDTGEPPVGNTSPTGRKFPPGLGAVMAPLHDELSKRTSGELPSDYDDAIRAEWAAPQRFDRDPGYDPSWVLYDRFDIYGNPRK